MADIRDIATGSIYTGNAALGGRRAPALMVDPSPFQRLGAFTYYRDRDRWQQKVAEDKEAALKLADITGFDPNSPLKPFNEDLKAQLDDIQKFYRENPDATVYSRNPEKFTIGQEKINKFQNSRKGATANGILFEKAHADIEKIQDPQQRELRRRELNNKVDKLFKGGVENAYSNLIDSLPELKIADYEIPQASITKRSFLTIDPNNNIETTMEYIDPEFLMAQSELIAAQPQGTLDESSDYFQRLSPEEQVLERDRQKITGEKRRSMQKISADFNTLLDQWKEANPNIDINTVNPDDLPDGTLENNVKAILSINKQIDELNRHIAQGEIKDNFGVVRKAPYAKIDFANGLSEAEVIAMTTLQRSGNSILTNLKKDATYTGDATRREGQQLDYQAAWARANKGTGDKLLDAIEAPARAFGKHIDRVKAYFKTHPGSDNMIVTYKSLDDDTFKALKLDPSLRTKEDVWVKYNADGSFNTGVKAKKNKGKYTITDEGRPGTIEEFQKGLIDAAKVGQGEKGGVQSEGFQTNAENGFYKIWGTNDIQDIWNNWDKYSGKETQPSAAGTVVRGTGGGGSDTRGAVIKTRRGTFNGKPNVIIEKREDGKWYDQATGQEVK